MDVEDRYVTFGPTVNGLKNLTYETAGVQRIKEKKPGYEAVKDGIRLALDAAGNAGQYIRYANMKIEKHQEQINHIKKLHDKFDREIQSLQSQNLEKINLDNNMGIQLSVKTITKTLDQLLLGKRLTKTKLRTLESQLGIAEKELEEQERQIEDVRENLNKTHFEGKNILEKENDFTTLNIIKKELKNLGQNNDVSKLSDAIDVLASSDE